MKLFKKIHLQCFFFIGTFRTVRHSLHMSIHFQGCYVWLGYERLCPNYSDIRSDNRMPSRIKMMSELSDLSKYVCKGEKALFSRTKWKFIVLHNVSAVKTQFSGVALKSSLSLLQVLESHLRHLRKVFVLVFMWQQISSMMILEKTVLFNQTFNLRSYAKNRSQWRNIKAWN